MYENNYKSVVIASGAFLSNAIEIEGYKYIGLIMPSDWTSADITFQVSHDGITFQDLYSDSGDEVSITAVQATSIAIDASALMLAPWRYIKIRSGVSAAAVNQLAVRTIVVALKG